MPISNHKKKKRNAFNQSNAANTINDRMMQLNKTESRTITSFCWRHRESPIKIILMRQTITAIYIYSSILLVRSSMWDASMTNKYGYNVKRFSLRLCFCFCSFLFFFFSFYCVHIINIILLLAVAARSFNSFFVQMCVSLYSTVFFFIRFYSLPGWWFRCIEIWYF